MLLPDSMIFSCLERGNSPAAGCPIAGSTTEVQRMGVACTHYPRRFRPTVTLLQVLGIRVSPVAMLDACVSHLSRCKCRPIFERLQDARSAQTLVD